MLVLFGIQVVQTKKNESSWKKKKQLLFVHTNKKKCNLAKKVKNLN